MRFKYFSYQTANLIKMINYLTLKKNILGFKIFKKIVHSDRIKMIQIKLRETKVKI